VQEFLKRLPATLFLAFLTLLFALSAAIFFALTGAFFRTSFINEVITFLTFTAVSLPAFLLGLLILQFVVLEFGFGRVIAGGSWLDALFPAFCLALGRAGEWAQILRANLLEELEKNYIFTARARGASRFRLLWRYALPNALLPFLTAVGIGIGSLLGGAAVIEAVFSYPGIGSYVFSAVEARDLPVIQGFVVVTALIYMTVNLAIDALSAWLNPQL
jgi:ABC-type dipeptide/oligopeptide/nickel transport system permease component